MADELVVEADEEEFVCEECGDSFTTERGLASHAGQKHKDEPDDAPEVVAVDDEGYEYIEAPDGGLFGDDGLTNHQRTVNPSYEPRADGLVGVGEDYPAQASRAKADD